MPEQPGERLDTQSRPLNEDARGLDVKGMRNNLSEIKKKELIDRLREGNYTHEQVFERDEDLFNFIHEQYLGDEIFGDAEVAIFKECVEDYLESQGYKFFGEFRLGVVQSDVGVNKFVLHPEDGARIRVNGGDMQAADNFNISLYFGDKTDEELAGNNEVSPPIPESITKINTPDGHNRITGGTLPDGRSFVLSREGEERWGKKQTITLEDGTSYNMSAPDMQPKSGTYLSHPDLGSFMFSMWGHIDFTPLEGEKIRIKGHNLRED